jgi:hypothetical protein
MSVLVIIPVSSPACENMMCRKFYKKKRRSAKQLDRQQKRELTSLRNMFTTSSSGTSFRNCIVSSNSGDRSAESPSCGPRNLPMRVAPPLSERRGAAKRVVKLIEDYRADKGNTNL